MYFELFVSLRYLLARRKQAFISVISLISVFGVAIGVASLIVVLGGHDRLWQQSAGQNSGPQRGRA